MKILQTSSFIRSVKKFHPNEKKALDKAVQKIIANPKIGEAKVGDLAGIFIFKFKVGNIKWLLAYENLSKREIMLLLVAPHENFYRDLKKQES
jgi:mRNA-degrading endonuclease RelE of RelBE toxin-antitoxin system